ncbi:MAG: DMT family transporter [Gammaproteobacteria bacterium]|nr:DMT family transporter [Gammaproteobacteria bacterium]
MNKSNLSYGYAICAVLLWSTVATAFKLALSHYSPIQLVFIAVITSIITLFSIIKIQGKFSLIISQFKQQPLFYLQAGLLNPFLYYLVLFKAYDLLPAQQALALNYTWALLLPLLAVPFLGQKLSKTDMVAALIAYIGVYIIATQGNITSFNFDSNLGVLMGLLSTVLWSLYWIINTKDQGDPVISLFLSFMVGLPFITTALMVMGPLPTWDPQALLAGIYVGLFEMGITFVLWLLALKYAQRTANITTLAFLSPVLSIGFIALILDEKIEPATYVGLGLILMALGLQTIRIKFKKIAPVT